MKNNIYKLNENIDFTDQSVFDLELFSEVSSTLLRAHGTPGFLFLAPLLNFLFPNSISSISPLLATTGTFQTITLLIFGNCIQMLPEKDNYDVLGKVEKFQVQLWIY